jgi:LPXTG-site transpeptidase (sortase) family protein
MMKSSLPTPRTNIRHLSVLSFIDQIMVGKILYGVDEATLEKHPGWLESSAMPGQDGMRVIYGHRNRTYFQVLEKVIVGDTITVTMVDGTVYTYTISTT